MKLRPVEIIGGGLAGLSLGLALRRAGAPVVLHEAGAYPRHRVCGEFIAGLDADTRRVLRLDPFLSDARSCQEVRWFRADAALRSRPLPSPALALGRYALDLRLAEAFASAGGDLRAGSRVAADPAPGRVLAHGRRADARSPWMGLKIHALDLPLSAPLEVHLGREAYVGLCALAGGRVNVCGLFRRRPRLAFDRDSALVAHLRASGLARLAARLENAAPDPASACAVSALVFGTTPGTREDPDRLALGDAHALIPPFTGNGMTLAFQSAAVALEPLLAWARDEAGWRETVALVRARLRSRFRLRLWTSFLLHPVLLTQLGQTGLVAADRLRALPFDSFYQATR